jgi:hypothetical protein
MKQQTILLGLLIVLGAVLVAATHVPIITAIAQNMTTTSSGAAQNQTEMTSSTATNFTAQKTATSTVDALPGHEGHQAVIALPQRTDGKIWDGTVSWSSSKPVEVRLLQDYDTSIKPDAAHGESAIALILQSNGAGTVPSYNAGSMDFAASQVAFHTLGGVPFTVTYTIDAEAKSPTS